MANEISKITVSGVTYEVKDAKARELIESLGDAVYWIGVTTTKLTDGGSENPVTVGGEPITLEKAGGMAQYNGEEFIWNGTAWQSIGKNNFGDLAFKGSAETKYTPAGTISAPTATASPTTKTIYGIDNVGSVPTFTVNDETLTITAGETPTRDSGTAVVTGVTVTVEAPTFSGTQETITVK